jgi:hypothetical protein
MQACNGSEVHYHRQALLKAIEQLVANEVADLERRKANYDFYYYASFFSPAFLGLVAWEQVTRADLAEMPALKRYFCDALSAARATELAHGWRDKDVHRGEPRRSFQDIAAAELAANILPRLENILNCWGFFNDESGEIKERALPEEERSRLTRNYHAPI